MAALLLMPAACGWDDARILSIEAMGTVAGSVYLDQTRSGSFQTGDRGMAGAEILILKGGRAVADAESGPTGGFEIPLLPVGSYRLGLRTEILADSLEVLTFDTTLFTVTAGDTVRMSLGLTFVDHRIADVRQMPEGSRASLTGVALNAAGAFGDGSVHVADDGASIRVTRMGPAAVAAGDRVSLRGTVEIRNGLPTLSADPAPTLLGPSGLPSPEQLSTAVAASAAAGQLDARLARVMQARVLSVFSGGMIVDDGSGPLEVLLWSGGTATALPGAIVSATGILVPRDGGRWSLRPRGASDLEIAIRRATVAEARTLPRETLVSIVGIALNGHAAFGDRTIHLADATGGIRAFRAGAGIIEAGDSIEVVGLTAVEPVGLQPVLGNAAVTVLGRGTPFPLAELTTSAASSAVEGRLDAALVRVTAAAPAETTPVSGGVRFLLDDGTGELTVLAGFPVGTFPAAAVVEVTGVLVPSTSGSWLIRPRGSYDLVVR
jgi:hypothetical protein